MHDCLIIGGGVIGLSLAYELAGHGARVRVVDRLKPGREASWAAAGILPPAWQGPDATPLDQLHELGCRLHPEWAAQLQVETGIDTGFRRCGAVHLADEPLLAELTKTANHWREGRIHFDELSPDAAVQLEPALKSAADAGRLLSASLLHDEVQHRPPWNMNALEEACLKRGVDISADTEIVDFELAGETIRAARTNSDVIAAETYCIASGAWTDGLLKKLGLSLGIKPIRGQLVLLKTPQPILQRVVYSGGQYMVPRDDGRLLIGSTLEDVGFDHRVTGGAVSDLIEFAIGWFPELRSAELERSWAGLRPASANGKPIMGRVPGLRNAFVATGHYRSGWILAPATARLMSQLIRGTTPELDLAEFGHAACRNTSPKRERGRTAV